MYSYGSIVDILERQAMINGYLLLSVAILLLLGVAFGVYLIRHFVKSTDKVNTKWFLYVGVSLFSICLIGAIIFLWMAIVRLYNPTYYAIEYIKELQRFKKFLELPF